jgi:hypothetical protein
VLSLLSRKIMCIPHKDSVCTSQRTQLVNDAKTCIHCLR